MPGIMAKIADEVKANGKRTANSEPAEGPREHPAAGWRRRKLMVIEGVLTVHA
jgi:hypothetical protein